VPADEAAELTGNGSDEALVVFEMKNWKKSGRVYSAVRGRVAWVRSVKK
jgi:hypothetical protein